MVTPIAGTTRDAVDGLLDRAPVPLRFVDTAGLRDTDDTLERLGIEVSARYLASAHVVLACGATAPEVEAAIAAVASRTTALTLPVYTKVDLLGSHEARDAAWCYASAETGEGLASLLGRIDVAVADAAHEGYAEDEVVVTRERHQRGLREACEEITRFRDGWGSGALPATVAAVHLQSARDALSELVGAIGTEDVLDRVFAEFCIGK